MVTHAGSTKHKTSRRLQKIIIITVVVKRCDRPPPATEKQRYIRQHSVTDKCKSKNMNLNSISCTVKVQHPMSKYRNVVKTPDQTTLVQLFSCVRRSLSRHALLTLVRALIVSKVDYCNSVLAGIARPAAGPAAVRLECRRPFGLLSEAVRTHNPIAS